MTFCILLCVSNTGVIIQRKGDVMTSDNKKGSYEECPYCKKDKNSKDKDEKCRCRKCEAGLINVANIGSSYIVEEDDGEID
jgi:hypothetical protein